MKRRIIFPIVAAMFLAGAAVPVTAAETTSTSASASGIDLSGLSLEQLMDLRRELNIMIAEKSGDNTIGPGVYEVGVDIKPGKYDLVRSTIAYQDRGTLYAELYLTRADYKNRENYKSFYVTSDEDTLESVHLNLKEGNILRLDEEGIIYENTHSWAVE